MTMARKIRRRRQQEQGGGALNLSGNQKSDGKCAC